MDSMKSQTSCDSVDSLHLKCELTFHPSSAEDLDWLIKRLHGICNDVCATFIQMHVDPKAGKSEASLASDMALFFLVAPTSPEKPQKRLFTFELEDDPLSDGDGRRMRMRRGREVARERPDMADSAAAVFKGQGLQVRFSLDTQCQLGVRGQWRGQGAGSECDRATKEQKETRESRK